MIKNALESPSSNQEVVGKDVWQEKLRLAQEEKAAILEQAPDFYDDSLRQIYIDSALQFGANSEIFKKLGYNGYSYEELLDNYEKSESFRQEQLGPIERKLQEINSELTKIRRQEQQEQAEKKEQEREIQFQTRKKELSSRLYDKLDAIYAQIPPEAAEAGMKIEMAMAEYKPELSGSARMIEEFIERIEEAMIPYDLDNIEREMKDWKL
jgi:hypothetical protein